MAVFNTASGRPNIALVPAATINSASSRLRCFGLGRELAGMGYRVTVGIDPDNPPHVLLVQKIINADALLMAQWVHGNGGVVVYDIDDYGPEALGSLKADEATFSQFMQLVSIVIVDTETRHGVFLKEPGFTHIQEHWVIPDPIDYIESSNRETPKAARQPGEKLRACWFGNAPNIVPAIPYLQEIAASEEVRDVSVMLNADYVDYFHQNFPQFNTSAWKLETFPSLFSATDFCVLIHATTFEGVQKSNNKMLAALALGVVPFVSRTPAYEATALQMGIPELIVDSPKDVLDRIKPGIFDGIVKKMYSTHCSRELEQYFPVVSARMFSEKIQVYLEQRG
ncbi:hypothetical protein hmeg3_01925 [Herbaspirillum sp. meg3]|uniref:hypothetical protein n=1 Tax=Herbaspirillum sp. meg3 TaxID=2025949 RepID=UPI000B994A18|nr:hypothetical protein [Herbaspirillum sp. meg3]ASU37172.1 hypothetical protein hmeg3_01925 [Herbaspirillum sp. meg3]